MNEKIRVVMEAQARWAEGKTCACGHAAGKHVEGRPDPADAGYRCVGLGTTTTQDVRGVGMICTCFGLRPPPGVAW